MGTGSVFDALPRAERAALDALGLDSSRAAFGLDAVRLREHVDAVRGPVAALVDALAQLATASDAAEIRALIGAAVAGREADRAQDRR